MNIRPATLALILLSTLTWVTAPVIAGPAITQSRVTDWKDKPGDRKNPNQSTSQPRAWGQRPAGSGQKANALLSGSENANRTNKLTSEIDWHRSIGQAESVAAQQGKMILWVNLLGTMSGGT